MGDDSFPSCRMRSLLPGWIRLGPLVFPLVARLQKIFLLLLLVRITVSPFYEIIADEPYDVKRQLEMDIGDN